MIKKVFIFALGATVGSLVTWKLIKDKYEKIADEEIASVVDSFKKREDELKYCANDIINTQKAVIDVMEYDKKVEDLNYTATAGLAEVVEDTEGIFETEADIKEYVKPYVISPEEFGEFGATKCLTYYSDFVLANDEDNIVVDPEYFIGDALEHFGEYEDDCVHVRNESLEVDFEILRSEKSFAEIHREDN